VSPSLQNLLLIGSGGFAGAILRYTLGGLVHRHVSAGGLPYGTLAVNLLGCLLIGALAGLADSRPVFSPGLRVFLFIGLLGGFTTFSTFGYETFALARDGEFLQASLNIVISVVLGLALLWGAYLLTARVSG
jgi:CrcB protein